MPSVIIEDDHTMFRQGLVSLLDNESDIEVIGQAANGKEVLDLLPDQTPDVILLDIEMPKMDGFDTIRAVQDFNKSIKILTLTMHDSPEFIKNIFKAGASGYLSKDVDKVTLVQAIHTVHQEGSYYSQETSKLIMESLREMKSTASISEREREIIRLIADEFTTKEIAEQLHLSPHTIESHR
ncbi:MAG: response regulator transcription factor, partial [Saprospiraceae bacterium]|nr:response regulator transcription factor [Saprospiraceae bacterium]